MSISIFNVIFVKTRHVWCSGGSSLPGLVPFLLGVALLLPALLRMGSCVDRTPQHVELRVRDKGPKKRALVVLFGGAFRGGHGGTVSEVQGIASDSHVRFIHYVQERYNYDIDVILSTYSTEYDKDLLGFYNSTNVVAPLLLPQPMIGIQELMRKAAAAANNIQQYDWLFAIRIDLFVKPLLTEIFDPTWDKVLFPSVCFVLQGWHKTGNGMPRITDTLLFIPRKYITLPIWISHDGWPQWFHENHLNHSEMGTMVKTYHDSDALKDWNPLYYMMGRQCTQSWYSKGLEFDHPGTMEPINSTITYDEYESPDHITTGDVKCVGIPDEPSPYVRNALAG